MQNSPPLISVCIPAYKNIGYLRRLLDSIAIQTFLDFEVVVSDDSPDLAIKALCESYSERFVVRYFRNDLPLGTPENWNEAIRKANGEWIKIMHDDDWFAGPVSLAEFARAAGIHREAAFFFCAYRNVYLDEKREQDVFLPAAKWKAFLQNRDILLARNLIGPPSVVLYKRLAGTNFDPNIKWVVDIEFYLRYLQANTPYYLDKVLVNIGMGKDQVTRDSFRRRNVEVPENFYLLSKTGWEKLRNISVYDACWRLIRNMAIKSRADIADSGYTGFIPPAVLSMIRWQRTLPDRWWRFGPLSKTGMFLNYLFNLNRLAAA